MRAGAVGTRAVLEDPEEAAAPAAPMVTKKALAQRRIRRRRQWLQR
jgi:hypothetical protein